MCFDEGYNRFLLKKIEEIMTFFLMILLDRLVKMEREVVDVLSEKMEKTMMYFFFTFFQILGNKN